MKMIMNVLRMLSLLERPGLLSFIMRAAAAGITHTSLVSVCVETNGIRHNPSPPRLQRHDETWLLL